MGKQRAKAIGSWRDLSIWAKGLVFRTACKEALCMCVCWIVWELKNFRYRCFPDGFRGYYFVLRNGCACI